MVRSTFSAVNDRSALSMLLRVRALAWRIRPATVALGAIILVGAGISFADTPGTTLTVSPATNLPDNASVNVSGAGFGANVSGFIVQCVPADSMGTDDCSDDIGLFTTNASGTFGPVPVNVTRTFLAGGLQRSCPGTYGNCTVFAEVNTFKAQDHATISFSSGGTTTTVTIPPTTTTSTSTIPPTTTTSTSTIPPTTTTSTSTIPPTTTTSIKTVPTITTSSTTVPRTTTTSSTTVPTTTTSTSTIPPTTTTSTTVLTTSTTVADQCALLRAQQAAVNAQITAVRNALPGDLSAQDRAAYIARLEALREQANAQYAGLLASKGCSPAANAAEASSGSSDLNTVGTADPAGTADNPLEHH